MGGNFAAAFHPNASLSRRLVSLRFEYLPVGSRGSAFSWKIGVYYLLLFISLSIVEFGIVTATDF